MIIVYTSKPYMAKQLLPLALAQYPNKKIVFIHSMYFTNVMMDYPKDIKWQQFPYVQDTQFKLNSIDKWRATTPENGTLIPADISMDDIRHCEEIIYMGDPCYYDVYSFSIFIEKVFHQNVEQKHIDSAILYSLAPQEIQSAWNKKFNFYETFQHEINYGKVSRYFDYNFNFNSFALISKIYKYIDKNFNQVEIKVGNKAQEVFFSKYMLQLLYFVREQEIEGSNFTEGRLIQQMSQWKGTGKYDFKSELGGAASRTSIIENLINLKLLKINQKEIFMTEKGKSFLQALPKDCIDYDLPFRIKLWAKQPFEISKVKIDTYLNNYYKKVKNKIKALAI
jgi:hypothetical protein